MPSASAICYFDPDTYPGVYNSCNILVEQGWEVDVLALDFYGFGGKAFDPRVTVHRLGGGDWQDAGGITAFVCFLRGLRELRRQRHWDLVFGHDMMGFVAARMAQAAPADRTAFWSQDLVEPGRLSTARRCVYRLKRYFLRTCPLAIAASESRATAMQETLPLARPPTVVYNSPRRNIQMPADGVWRSKLGLTDDTLLGVYAGGLGHNRYVPELIASVQDWPQNVHLAVAGYGRDALLDELKVTAERQEFDGRIHILGHLQSPFSLLADADFGVSLFDQDPGHRNLRHRGLASNKIFENLAFGNAVVVTRNSETAALVEERYHCGTCVDDHSAAGIATCVRSIVRDREQLAEMQKQARRVHLEETHFERRFNAITAQCVSPMEYSEC